MSICLRRREFIAGLGGAAAWPLAARAQQPSRMRLVEALFFGDTYRIAAALRQELQRLGWGEGRTLRIDYRFSGNDLGRATAHAAELVNLGPDVIFVVGGPAVQAVQRRTQTIPIVFVGGGDLSDNELTGGIARPVGNTTGFANTFNSIGGKYLELLKDAAPRITRVAHVARTFDGRTSGRRGGLAACGTRTAGRPLRRIGVLMAGDEAGSVLKTYVSAFTQALKDLGWIDSPNVRVDVRWGRFDTNRTRALAQELVDLQPDIILANSTPATIAVQRETRTIPIVFVGVADPVASGIVPRLNEPGGRGTYPARPVRIIVGVAAGGSADLLARSMGQYRSGSASHSLLRTDRAARQYRHGGGPTRTRRRPCASPCRWCCPSGVSCPRS
jgi:ABC-type uncharacterized transport system substrate-binding protein